MLIYNVLFRGSNLWTIIWTTVYLIYILYLHIAFIQLERKQNHAYLIFDNLFKCLLDI